MELEFQRVSLSTIGGPLAEARWLQEFDNALERLKDPAVATAKGIAKATITFKVELEYRPDSDRLSATSGVSAKLPALMGTHAPLRDTGGSYVVEKEPEQELIPWKHSTKLEVS